MCQLLSGQPLANAVEDDEDKPLDPSSKKGKKTNRGKERKHPVSKPVVIDDDNPPRALEHWATGELLSSMNYGLNLLTMTPS